jgi:glutamate formiminotransferase
MPRSLTSSDIHQSPACGSAAYLLRGACDDPDAGLLSNRMTARLLEAVPNFSEGRDRSLVQAIVEAMGAAGADVLDWHMDEDHHRSVVTVVGVPEVVEEAAIAGARVAVERIDMTRHRGVHPRIGAVDVLPFVPLVGLTLPEARASARRVGARIVRELGVPIFYYGQASDPPGRKLSDLRRGGFELLVAGWTQDRTPDSVPDVWPYAGAHPTAGVTCVGARRVLLAWNVRCEGVDLAGAMRVAGALRERSGGLAGVRALAFELPSRGTIQISMNVEDPDVASPIVVFARLEQLLADEGGNVVETEVVGLVPDTLMCTAAADRLRLEAGAGQRLLSARLVKHLAEHCEPRPSVPPLRGE